MGNECTLWVSSTVVTIKPNVSIRLWLNSRNLNKAVKCNPYYVRTIDDVILKGEWLSPLQYFRRTQWVNLAEESNRLCTFNTPWKKYRWTRLPFGLTCSGDVFQEKMDMVFGRLEGPMLLRMTHSSMV